MYQFTTEATGGKLYEVKAWQALKEGGPINGYNVIAIAKTQELAWETLREYMRVEFPSVDVETLAHESRPLLAIRLKEEV